MSDFYLTKSRSVVRQLRADPSSNFARMESIIGFRACVNLTVLLSLKLDKGPGSCINWNLIRNELNVLATNFVTILTFRD